MGGLIVKKVHFFVSWFKFQAFLLARERDSHYSKVEPNLQGVVFMGTPHHGARLAKILQGVLGTVFSKKLFVNQLGPYCRDTEEIFNAFNRFEISNRAISFYESAGMGLFNHVLNWYYGTDVGRWSYLNLPRSWVMNVVLLWMRVTVRWPNFLRAKIQTSGSFPGICWK